MAIPIRWRAGDSGDVMIVLFPSRSIHFMDGARAAVRCCCGGRGDSEGMGEYAVELSSIV